MGRLVALALLLCVGLGAAAAPSASRAEAAGRTPSAREPGESGEVKRADKVVVRKADRELLLFRGAQLLRRYTVALGFEPEGPKREQGDGRTPEGEYRLVSRNPESRFHRSLQISYPSASDRKAAAERGVAPGGAIMIHGLPNEHAEIGRDHTTADWTDGCIAVTNREMDEIWALVDDGTPIEILP